MASELAQFFIRLGTIFDDSGLKAAQKGVKATEEGTQSLVGSLGKLGAAVGVGAAIWKLVDFSQASIDAYAEQERANNRLQAAMQNLGVFTKAAFDEQIKFASSLQATSTFADEQITETQALLTTYGLYGDKLKNTTKSALDLAAGLGIDLRTATMILGKAFQGETGTLQRYGIQIQDTGRVADNFQQVMEQVNRRFGGRAAAETETYAGKVIVLKNKFSDLKEEIGIQLLPIANEWLKWINSAIDATTSLIKVDEQAARGRELTINRLQQEIESYRSLRAERRSRGKGEDEMDASLLEQINKRIKALEREKTLLAEEKALHGTPLPGKPTTVPPELTDEARRKEDARREEKAKDLQDLTQKAQGEIDSAMFTEDRIAFIKSEAQAKELERNGQFELAKDLREAARVKVERKQNEDRIKNFSATLNTIATLSQSHNKTLAFIGKAAAIAQATIDTFAGVGKALALGPIIGPPLAALVLTAGFANVARISGVALAEGGLVRARAGGTAAIVGEGGRDEAVVPLDDPEVGRRLLGGAGRETSVTVYQTNTFGGNVAALAPGGDVADILEKIRQATKYGVAEALDAAKEIYETGRARSAEA